MSICRPLLWTLPSFYFWNLTNFLPINSFSCSSSSLRLFKLLKINYSVVFFWTAATTSYSSVFQPGFRGTQRFRQFLTGFPEHDINSTILDFCAKPNNYQCSRNSAIEKGWKPLSKKLNVMFRIKNDQVGHSVVSCWLSKYLFGSHFFQSFPPFGQDLVKIAPSLVRRQSYKIHSVLIEDKQ